MREKGARAYPGTAQIFPVPPIISGTRKATNFKFDRCIHSVHANKRPLKIWEKRERGRIQGLPKFFYSTPIISGMRKATNFKFGRYIHSDHANKRPLKFWGKTGALAYSGTSEIFKDLLFQNPIISETRKATNFKFGKYIQRFHANKLPLNLEVKGAWAYPGSR